MNPSRTWEMPTLVFAIMTLATVLTVAVAVCGLVANALLIYTVLRQATLRHSPTFVTLVSLASSDFLALLSSGFFIFMLYAQRASSVLCSLFMYTSQLAVASSAHHLMAFSVLRYIILVKPLFAIKHLTVRATIMMCGVIWTVNLSFALYSAVEVHVVSYNFSYNSTVSICMIESSSLDYLLCMMTLIVLIPMATMVIFHVAKVHQLRKRSAQLERSSGTQVSIKVVAGILITFLVISVPNGIYWMSLSLVQEVSVDMSAIAFLLSAWGYLNHAINPLFYFFFSNRVRNNIWCCRRLEHTGDCETRPQQGVFNADIPTINENVC